MMTNETQAKSDKDQHRISWLYRIVTILMLALVAMFSYVLWLIVSPSVPLKINHVTILTPTVSSHGALIYRFDYCKSVDISPIVYRQLVPTNGDNAVPFASVLGITKPGCHATDIPLPMIPGTKPGKYRLKGHLVYQVNSLRSVSIDYLTDEFTVTE